MSLKYARDAAADAEAELHRRRRRASEVRGRRGGGRSCTCAPRNGRRRQQPFLGTLQIRRDLRAGGAQRRAGARRAAPVGAAPSSRRPRSPARSAGASRCCSCRPRRARRRCRRVRAATVSAGDISVMPATPVCTAVTRSIVAVGEVVAVDVGDAFRIGDEVDRLVPSGRALRVDVLGVREERERRGPAPLSTSIVADAHVAERELFETRLRRRGR